MIINDATVGHERLNYKRYSTSSAILRTGLWAASLVILGGIPGVMGTPDVEDVLCKCEHLFNLPTTVCNVSR